jgi:hypothetical protein
MIERKFESLIEHYALVELLRNEGRGEDPNILLDEEARDILEKWKEQQYGRNPTELIIEEGNLFFEAGYPGVAIDQLYDALHLAELEDKPEFEEKIKARMFEINPELTFPPKQ